MYHSFCYPCRTIIMTTIDTLSSIQGVFDACGAHAVLARIRLTRVFMIAMMVAFPILNIPFNPDGRYMWTNSITPSWSCSKCGGHITSAIPGVGDPIGVHMCLSGFSIPRDLAMADGLITTTNQCFICGESWSKCDTHTCRHPFVNSYGYDLTDVLGILGQIAKGLGVSGLFLKMFRTTPFNLVVINREYHR